MGKIVEDLLRTLLSTTTETEVLEFKQSKNSYAKDKLGQYFSVLGNEANLRNKTRAYLLFGVDNSKQIVGTTITAEKLN